MGMTRLINLEAAEVSLVDQGANMKKRFPVTKGKNNMTTKEMIQKMIDTELPEEAKLGEFKKGLSEQGRTAFEAMFRTLAGFRDELPANVIAKAAEELGLEAPKAPAPELASELASEPETKVEGEEIAKALRSELEIVKKNLVAERNIRVTAEWVAKCEKNLSHYPGKSTADMAKVLKSLADVDPKLADAQFETMKAASDAIKKGALLEVHGLSGEGTDGAWEKIQKAANEIAARDKVSMSEAISKACASDPALYDAYLAEGR